MATDLVLGQAPPGNLLPIRFDFAAAQRAAQALRATADAVDRSARMRASDSRRVEKAFGGRYQQVFATAENGLDRDASVLVRRLRAAAEQLHDAAASARAENARRERGLREWQADLDRARRRQNAVATGATP